MGTLSCATYGGGGGGGEESHAALGATFEEVLAPRFAQVARGEHLLLH